MHRQGMLQCTIYVSAMEFPFDELSGVVVVVDDDDDDDDDDF